jgi:hypothetical protein
MIETAVSECRTMLAGIPTAPRSGQNLADSRARNVTQPAGKAGLTEPLREVLVQVPFTTAHSFTTVEMNAPHSLN